MKKRPDSVAAQLQEAAAQSEPMFDSPKELQAARIAGAAVVLHALLSSVYLHEPAFDEDKLIDQAFRIADKFLAKAGP